MRLILKLLSLPLILVTWIVYAICRLFVIASGAVLGVLAGLVFMASIVLFFKAGVIAGLSWLAIAFLISPYGLPMDGKDRRTELCATGLSRKLTNKIDFERGVSASRSFHLY